MNLSLVCKIGFLVAASLAGSTQAFALEKSPDCTVENGCVIEVIGKKVPVEMPNIVTPPSTTPNADSPPPPIGDVADFDYKRFKMSDVRCNPNVTQTTRNTTSLSGDDVRDRAAENICAQLRLSGLLRGNSTITVTYADGGYETFDVETRGTFSTCLLGRVPNTLVEASGKATSSCPYTLLGKPSQ